MQTLQNDDTIAAIATAPGMGAIGVIRVSGPEAIQKVNALFPAKDLAKAEGYTLHFGPLKEGDELLDEVVISLFRAPKSYTGEDTIEISGHGSPVVLERVLQAVLNTGVRNAKAGEFTLRAFLNGKMDLAQAEAVADLIASESSAAHKAALNQMRGGFSGKIQALRDRLVHFASLIELELDFAEEDVEFASRPEFENLLRDILSEIDRLMQSFRLGNVIKKGVSVVIAGRPNAGKSTLLNALLEEERAIVSHIPGTTRDAVEDVISIGGVQFRFTDTAGIREATDEIERMGIERTHERIGRSHLVIYLFDLKESTPEEVLQDLQRLPLATKPIIVGNKLDLVQKGKTEEEVAATLRIQYQEAGEVIFISGKTHFNMECLQEELLQRVNLDLDTTDWSMVTNARHYEALKDAHKSVRDVLGGLRSGLTTDLLTVDIRRALQSMGEITGEVTTDEILGNIFSKFCIGK